MKTTILLSKNSMNRSPVSALVLIPLVFVCFALSPQAQATCQDACLSNNNTVQGDDALISLTTGTDNTAIGFNVLFNNTTGSNNTASGFEALFNNTIANNNTATGYQALFNNTTGDNNTATGVSALLSNTIGVSNTATGVDALIVNTTGNSNTATGASTLIGNTSGSGNTATGAGALFASQTGSDNTATGADALFFNTSGAVNTASGFATLYSNTTGSNNTASGFEALFNNTTGEKNSAVGVDALRHNRSGNNNIAVGFGAGVNLIDTSNNIEIGNRGVTGEAGAIRIGTVGTHRNTFIAGVSGVAVAGGVGVIIDGNGQLGTVVSSARFKNAIKPMDKASEAIFALHPVTFRYKKNLDPNGIPQFGLVAEDVEKVNPDLVARDEQGKPYTVRYEAVNAMLLNEFLKEHREVQEQKATIVELRSALAQQQEDFQVTAAHQQKQIEALTTGLQKVSAQVEASKPAPQTVLNNR